MQIFKHLRFNCWLVPLMLVGCAAGGIVAVHVAVDVRACAREAAVLTAALAEGGRRLGELRGDTLSSLRGIDVGWVGLTRLTWRDERFRSESSIGVPDIDAAMPMPELVSAVHAPQSWRRDDGDWGIAAPIVGADGLATGVLVGRHVAGATPAWDVVAVAVGLVVALGVALGGYLVRHLHRPVEALQRAAESAMTGEPTDARDASEETSACASAVHALAERYRSSRATPARAVED
ncbi:MAG: hypothetical protein H0W72_07455 [Planctomycetes bacterium]|nr:hypothetical protein [Planctomycetota bacterium]